MRCLIPQRQSACLTEAEEMGDKQGERQMLPLSPRQVGMIKILPYFSSSTRGPWSNLQQHFLKFSGIYSIQFCHIPQPPSTPPLHQAAQLKGSPSYSPAFPPYSLTQNQRTGLTGKTVEGTGQVPVWGGGGRAENTGTFLALSHHIRNSNFPSWKVYLAKRH